ncbi:MAG: DUF1269 domain-containing protein [Chloroflexi bacterium]|nr:DUF1269 domain-containing protein [Chloroflexota bacterium]
MAGPIELIVAAYNDDDKADAVLQDIKEHHKNGTILLLNAAVLSKDEKGKATIKETADVDAKQGAIFGAVIGGLIGLLGGPAGVIAGAAAGAATGGVTAHNVDMGFDDKFLKQVEAELTPDSSALIALIEHEWVGKLLKLLEDTDARLLQATIAANVAEQLKQAVSDGEEGAAEA